MKRLIGQAAIDHVDEHGGYLCKLPDPRDSNERDDLTVDEARGIAGETAEGPSYIYVDVPGDTLEAYQMGWTHDVLPGESFNDALNRRRRAICGRLSNEAAERRAKTSLPSPTPVPLGRPVSPTMAAGAGAFGPSALDTLNAYDALCERLRS